MIIYGNYMKLWEYMGLTWKIGMETLTVRSMMSLVTVSGSINNYISCNLYQTGANAYGTSSESRKVLALSSRPLGQKHEKMNIDLKVRGLPRQVGNGCKNHTRSGL